MRSRFLEQSEIKNLQTALGSEAFLPLLVSLETGIRIGDVVALKRSAIKKDGIHYQAKKTKKWGIAKISAKTRKKLLENDKNGEIWLFPSPYKAGRHITRQAIWQRLKKAGKSCGIDLDGLSPHSLRKVFAVELYREKGFQAVKEALQHNYSATTEIYTFADWNTGENASMPLTRKDLPLIVKMVLEAIGKEKT